MIAARPDFKRMIDSRAKKMPQNAENKAKRREKHSNRDHLSPASSYLRKINYSLRRVQDKGV